jgi:hypothetical protein
MSSIEPGLVYRRRTSEGGAVLATGGQGRWVRVTPVAVDAGGVVTRVDADGWMDDAHLESEYELINPKETS